MSVDLPRGLNAEVTGIRQVAFVVLITEERRDRAHEGVMIREDPDDPSASFDLLPS